MKDATHTSCTIVMYHYIRDLKHSRYPEIKGLDFKLFKQQLDFLQKEYEIIKMEQLVSAVVKAEPLPPRAALLTFDDGYIDHYTYAFPQLYLRGLQGSFFVPAAVVEKNRVLDVNKIHYILASADENSILEELYLLLDSHRKSGGVAESNEELRSRFTSKSRYDTPGVVFIKSLLQHGLESSLRSDIADKLFKKFVSNDEAAFSKEIYLSYDQITLMKKCGMYFGLHGYDHLWLGKTDAESMKNDVKRALDYWSNVIDVNYWVINYPYGNHNPDVKSFIGSIGCKVGLTTRVAVANVEANDALELPRMDTNDFPPKSENYKSIGL